jgi:hypothetical protein
MGAWADSRSSDVLIIWETCICGAVETLCELGVVPVGAIEGVEYGQVMQQR